MANQRAEQPENKRKEAKAKDQHRKANKRAEDKRQEANAKCNEDSDEDENVEKNREEIIKRMRAAGIAEKRKMRDGRSFEQWKEDCEQERERKKNQKESMGEVEREFAKINCKHQKRKLRSERTGKEKLKQNLKAKKGMRIFHEVGRLIEHKDRIKPNSSEVVDWENFQKKSKRHADMLDETKPDIVQKINEKMRDEGERLREQIKKAEEKELVRKKQIEEDGGEWVNNAEYDDYHWVGEGEPPEIDKEPEYKPLSAKQLEEIQRQQDIQLEAIIEEQKKKAREKRKQKEEELKAAMQHPVPPLPEKEMCEYEKLRENNIKEREKAMAESGYFEDLHNYKKKIGFN